MGRKPLSEHHDDKITCFCVGGCFLQTQQELRVGRSIFVSLWDTPAGAHLLKGEVRYLLKPGRKLPPDGAGIEFVGLSEEDRRTLQDLVSFYLEKDIGAGATSATTSAVTPAPPRTPQSRGSRLWFAGIVIGAAVLLLCGAIGAVWHSTHKARPRVAIVPSAVAPAGATATMDAKQLAAAKISEARQLSSSGDAAQAITRLREAATLEPTNAEAHRQLARLLGEGGEHRVAIAELRTVTQIAPFDADAWRQLAAAQFAANLYSEAANSYARYFALSAEAVRDDSSRLSFADALRLANRTNEARVLYRKLASSPVANIARASKQRLAQLNPRSAVAAMTSVEPDASAQRSEPTSPANGPLATVAVAPPSVVSPAAIIRASAPTPARAVSPAERYQQGLTLWASNRTAAVAEFQTAANGGHADAFYYLGLNMAEGREPRTLKRAELVAALNYFQHARTSRFSAQARRYEDQLGKEYDRRRNQ